MNAYQLCAKPVCRRIDPLELQPSRTLPQIIEPSDQNYPSSPLAKWRGKIDLGGDELDVYVLDTQERVISLGATVKAIANAESGDLAKFIGVSSLNPFINKDLILADRKVEAAEISN